MGSLSSLARPTERSVVKEVTRERESSLVLAKQVLYLTGPKEGARNLCIICKQRLMFVIWQKPLRPREYCRAGLRESDAHRGYSRAPIRAAQGSPSFRSTASPSRSINRATCCAIQRPHNGLLPSERDNWQPEAAV